MQSLRLRVPADATLGTNRIRNYLLLVIAVLQPLLVLWCEPEKKREKEKVNAL